MMKNMNKLFFELIQVAIGKRVCLSHTPSAAEWQTLYDMALKQSLLGICFAGVQKLQKQQQCPPEMLYLKWIGMAAKIQQKNETVNKQCVELQARLASDGFKSCVLKGQGVALYYNEGLRRLRQVELDRRCSQCDYQICQSSRYRSRFNRYQALACTYLQ